MRMRRKRDRDQKRGGKCGIEVRGSGVCRCRPCDVGLGMLAPDPNMYHRNIRKRDRGMRWHSSRDTKLRKGPKISPSVRSYQRRTEHDWSLERRSATIQTGSQSSPASRAQSECCCMAFHLPCGKCLGEQVGNHVVCGTINKFEDSSPHRVPDEMIMLSSSMKVIGGGKRERRLIIAVKYGGGTDGAEKFADKASQPDAFLRGMHGCDILRLGCG